MSEGEASSSAQPRDVCAPRSTPNSAWVCGYAELGKCCASGPTRNGRCGLTATHANHDRAAGETEQPPCIPRRTYQWRRQSLRMNLAILTGGILLLCMSLPSREKTFVPGELSSKHAQILDNTLVSQRCGLCHPNSHAYDSHLGGHVEHDAAVVLSGEGLGGQASKTGRFQTGPVSEGEQDALCMQCHKGHMPAAMERTPHDLSSAVLRALTVSNDSPTWQTVGDRRSNQDDHAELVNTNCAACHVEHHGRGFDLKAMADDRCQACHRRKFESFTSGHPEFKNFPAERRRSLVFSHQLHADKHFPQKNRDFDCRQCHLDPQRPAAFGPVTRSVRFETACAECHHEPIRAATAGGWAVLQLPSVDAAAAAIDSQLEHWPAEARFGFEGTISPVLRALLEADENAQEVLASLPESGELSDIPLLGDQREQVTKTLALATERLIRETAREGQAAWRERLSKVARARAGRELDAHDIALIEAMCAGLPPDLFRQMQSTWFQRDESLAVSMPSAADSAGSFQQAIRAPVLALSEPIAPPLAETEPDRSPSRRMQGIVVERNANGLLVGDEAAADDELLLGDVPNRNRDDSLDDALLDNDAPLSEGFDSHDKTQPADWDLLGSEPTDSPGLEVPELNRTEGTQRGPTAPLRGATHLAGGGWYIDHATLALRYMPTGHADQTLAAWNMWWATFSVYVSPGAADLADPAQPASSLMPTASIPRQIPGGCIQCHQLSSAAQPTEMPGPSLAAAWRVALLPPGTKEFTKFDHAPHLSLPAVNDCRYCHVLNDKSPAQESSRETAGGYGQLVSVMHGAPHLHTGSEFRDMQLSQCVACHRPSGANSSCLQCHNYHISTPPQTSASQK